MPFQNNHKINLGRKRKPFSLETKKKMSESHKGKIQSEETKNRNRLSQLKRWDEKGRIGSSERNKAKAREWRKRNSKKIKMARKEWLKKNYDRILFLNSRRRAKRNNAEGSHTQGEWELLKKQYGYKCPCCGKTEPEIKLTEDHIIPLDKGGSDYIENIQPLCRSCNCSKHTKIIKYEK